MSKSASGVSFGFPMSSSVPRTNEAFTDRCTLTCIYLNVQVIALRTELTKMRERLVQSSIAASGMSRQIQLASNVIARNTNLGSVLPQPGPNSLQGVGQCAGLTGKCGNRPVPIIARFRNN